MKNFNITKHFTYHELTNTRDHPELLQKNREYFAVEPYLSRLEIAAEYLLENIRECIDAPLMVNNGGRCPELNAAVGGVDTSQHRFELPGAGAFDIWTPAMGVEDLSKIILTKSSVQWYQLRVYPGHKFIHIGMPRGKNDGQVKIVLDRVPTWYMDHAEGDK